MTAANGGFMGGAGGPSLLGPGGDVAGDPNGMRTLSFNGEFNSVRARWGNTAPCVGFASGMFPWPLQQPAARGLCSSHVPLLD